jgi:uncharacterized protein (TIGR03000 family)
MKLAMPVLVAGAFLLSTPVWAQHRGGHGGVRIGGGAAHFGGGAAHFGGVRSYGGVRGFSGYHPHSYAAYRPSYSRNYGNYGRYGNYGYYRPYRHYGRYGYGNWWGYAPSYYNSYYYAPSYGYANYYSPYYDDYYSPYYDNYPYSGYYPYSDYYTNGDYYADVTPPVTTAVPAPVSPAAAVQDTIAHLTVAVPSDADVWFNGTHMSQTGSVREFVSPPLTPGMAYTYDIRARWMVDGVAVDRTKQVVVHAGDQLTVDFITGG